MVLVGKVSTRHSGALMPRRGKENKMSYKMFFVLGGNDAEMTLISALLSQAGIRFVQPNIGWGDHEYTPIQLGLAIAPAQRMGEFGYKPEHVEGVDVVVFVECRPAKDEWPTGTTAVIDHHGNRSGEPASVLQVLEWLEAGGFRVSETTRRWVEVVGANDAGYIPAMVALGATAEEMARVRSLERLCRGITPKEEAEAERAIAAPAEFVGPYRVIHLAHSKCATVNDRLFESGRPERTLILSGDGEVNLYGDGETCLALKEKFEGWAGGAGLGKAEGQAFWGGYPPHDELVMWMKERFAS